MNTVLIALHLNYIWMKMFSGQTENRASVIGQIEIWTWESFYLVYCQKGAFLTY